MTLVGGGSPSKKVEAAIVLKDGAALSEESAVISSGSEALATSKSLNKASSQFVVLCSLSCCT